LNKTVNSFIIHEFLKKWLYNSFFSYITDDFKKNNLDSDVSDDDKELVATANNKRGNNDIVESDKEKNDEEDYTRSKESSRFEFGIHSERALSNDTRRRREKFLEIMKKNISH